MWDTVIAAGGLIVAGAALARGWLTDRRSAKGTAETRAAITEVQRNMADALQRLAAAAEKAPSGTAGIAPGSEAMLSAAIAPIGLSHQLVVTNTGDGPAEVIDVQVLGHPEVVVTDRSPRGRTLMPDERLSIVLALSMATPRALDILLAWSDSTGPHERVQTVDS